MEHSSAVDNVLANDVMALLCVLHYIAQLLLSLNQQHVYHLFDKITIFNLILVDHNLIRYLDVMIQFNTDTVEFTTEFIGASSHGNAYKKSY